MMTKLPEISALRKEIKVSVFILMFLYGIHFSIGDG